MEQRENKGEEGSWLWLSIQGQKKMSMIGEKMRKALLHKFSAVHIIYVTSMLFYHNLYWLLQGGDRVAGIVFKCMCVWKL